MELMVGIVITGVATAAGFAAFSSIVDNRERAREATRAVQRAASSRLMLASWFANARVLRDSGSTVPNFSSIGSTQPSDELRFVTTAPTPLGSQQTQVYMYIDRDPFTPENGLVAEFTALNQPVDSILQYVVSKKMEIEPTVMGLEVQLLDPSTKLWLTPFDLGTTTPIGLRVTLHADWGDTLPPLMRLPFVYPQGATR
jgi:type II secretory pathway pseudopilin PulG